MDYKNIKLSNCGRIIAQQLRQSDYIVVLCRALSEGEYTDMNGTPVMVDRNTLEALAINYNKKVDAIFLEKQIEIKESMHELDQATLLNAEKNNIEDCELLPNYTDHDMSKVRNIVGRIVGKIWVRESLGKYALFMNTKIKGMENVAPVADNRWCDLSVQYNPETHDLVELSWVGYGADPKARKIMGAPVQLAQSAVNPIADITNQLKAAEALVVKLDRKLLINKNLLGLCKLRKINKAQAFFIEKELNGVNDLVAINSMFRILDTQLSIPKKENFVELSEEEVNKLFYSIKEMNNVNC